jgi:hypothetical protein
MKEIKVRTTVEYNKKTFTKGFTMSDENMDRVDAKLASLNRTISRTLRFESGEYKPYPWKEKK